MKHKISISLHCIVRAAISLDLPGTYIGLFNNHMVCVRTSYITFSLMVSVNHMCYIFDKDQIPMFSISQLLCYAKCKTESESNRK